MSQVSRPADAVSIGILHDNSLIPTRHTQVSDMLHIGEPSTLEDEHYYFRQIGPLKLWLQHSGDEWLIASERLTKDKNISTSKITDTLPPHLKHTRYIIPHSETVITLQPTTPDRSVVVKPETSLKIAADTDALFFVLFPLWIRVVAGMSLQFTLDEIPSQVLSNTWFGEPHDGELCYFLKTWAKRSLEGLTPLPNWIVCPVHVRNISGSNLDFTRLCIRTGYLNIFKGHSWLWTNTVHVNFRGADKSSKIKYDTKPPAFEPDCRCIGKPRQKPPKEFTIKTFDTFNLFLGG